MPQDAPIGELAPGIYIVSTPIGTARDITLRALDVLAAADVIAAEDTRTARRLLDIHGVALGGRPLIAYHDHSRPAEREKLLRLAEEGRSVAYVSEAGTPLVADPGYQLVREAAARGVGVTAVPGPSAVLAALVLSGLPTDRFTFAGFAPASEGQRQRFLAELATIPSTLVLFESPKRVARLLRELAEAMGPEREAAVARELTKRFEEVERGTLAELARRFSARDTRGEVVVVIGRPVAKLPTEDEIAAAVEAARAEGASLRDASAAVAEALGVPRRKVYQIALSRSRGE
ncbi:MAG: 16S rRNA (cytidine(1402)-2'-O)-methyltransferase [Alphaproteobacteria bacterium]|nr:MAG: 16S rRNA (cytidine(1402)-2'-O)-methyltransferase [Alphaproteobacteria bacterium]